MNLSVEGKSLWAYAEHRGPSSGYSCDEEKNCIVIQGFFSFEKLLKTITHETIHHVIENTDLGISKEASPRWDSIRDKRFHSLIYDSSSFENFNEPYFEVWEDWDR